MINTLNFKSVFWTLLVLTTLTSCLPAQKLPPDVAETISVKAEIINLEKGELTAENIVQNRHITKYEQGGYFDCRSWTLEEADRGICDEKKIRDFIWSHWSEKKSGYIRVTYNSVDAQSTSHIFIEPNDNGNWRIARRIVRLHAIPDLSDQITEVQTLFQVEKVENKARKENWTIVLKNKNGKVIYEIPDSY